MREHSRIILLGGPGAEINILSPTDPFSPPLCTVY